MSQPTQDCKEPGVLVPEIDRNKCEGKADCVEVCPYHVFEIGKLDEEQRKKLSLVGKLKAFGHGYKQAFVVRADQCHACGLCVTACPEKAITLARPGRTS
jgi:NAD-dependent dihydropyrimidine dehydrogenase PreA subunit